MTACDEWNASDIGAHLAGIYEEVIRHLRAYAEGRPLSATRGFAEREAKFRALAPKETLAAIDRGDETMRAEISAILNENPGAELLWTGRQMRVDAFLTHLRSECALHRWDLAGDDEISFDLLASFDLFKHAVTAIGSGPMTARGVANGALGEGPFVARLRSDGQPDLKLTVDGALSLELVEAEGAPTIVTDQAARLLVIWGRRPQPPTRLWTDAEPRAARRLRQVLAGY